MYRLKIKEVIGQTEGMTMAKLSRRADLAYNTVLNLCADPFHDVNLSTLQKMADALQVTVLDLLEDIPAHEQ